MTDTGFFCSRQVATPFSSARAPPSSWAESKAKCTRDMVQAASATGGLSAAGAGAGWAARALASRTSVSRLTTLAGEAQPVASEASRALAKEAATARRICM